MKKLLPIALSLSLILSLYPATATAAEQTMSMPLSTEEQAQLDDIPIFFTFASSGQIESEGSMEKIKSALSAMSSSDDIALLQQSDFSISKLSSDERKILFQSDAYRTSLNRSIELLSAGFDVQYINFFVKPTPPTEGNSVVRTSRASDLDSTDYWEANFPYLGTYNGYKFLYTEAQIPFKSKEVEVGSISTKISWTTLFLKTLKTIVDTIVQDSFYQTATVAESIISNLAGSVSEPLEITYGNSSGSLGVSLDGDLYIRTVFIRDDLDRVKGYAYYQWGTSERLAVTPTYKMKYPVKKNASGTVEYEVTSKSLSKEIIVTPCYYNNTEMYKNIINLYIGASTNMYEEHIDVSGTLKAIVT